MKQAAYQERCLPFTNYFGGVVFFYPLLFLQRVDTDYP